MTTSRRPSAPLVTGLGALIAVAMALPLLAPSCSDFQPGQKLFAKGSLIIPMDVCYQYQTDGDRASYTPSSSCPGGTTENGDVIKAYGLVYQLIRNGVAVYWIIDPAKASLTTPDLTMQFNAGFPVLKYDWTGAAPSVAPNTLNHVVRYLGGPFVIDGSDAVKAAAIFQKYRSTFRPTATTGVNVHVANVAFQASVAKMLSGGWSAGGATPPKLALLNIGSSGTGAGSKNSEVVIRGYLQKAGLDISEPDPANPGVLLAAGGSATGPHGTIYDRLVMEDFIPTSPGAWSTTNLFKNGYQILWVPHWVAPGSCSDCPPSTSCTCANKYPAATIEQALQAIGAFGAAGKDIFAECVGLGSFEGITNNASYGTGTSTTHFQTVVPTPVPSPLPGGFNYSASGTPSPTFRGNYSSPLMQLGDYPFVAYSGAIGKYKPSGTTYINQAGPPVDQTVQLISESATAGSYDIFTHRPGVGGHGAFVYLGGHSYSGTDGTFQIGGTRLVLNTLFNLGAGCTESGVACDTGLLGKCGRGVFRCDAAGKTYCAQTEFGSPEVCNGLDDNCNGMVDEDILPVTCYDGPSNSLDPVTSVPKGACKKGVFACVGGVLSTSCVGQVLPSPEVCNGIDDDCNGLVDDIPPVPCYDGPASSLDPATGVPMGACKKGAYTCSGGVLSTTCVGQVTPRPDDCSCPECGSGQDLNCDGQIAQCGVCVNGTTRPCYDGPSGTANQGICKTGVQTCVTGNWTACRVCTAAEAALPTPPADCEILPATEVCNNTVDEDCNGIKESLALGSPQCGECTSGASRPCYVEPDPPSASPTRGVGLCHDGTQACVSGRWDVCMGMLQPGAELCNGLDDDCDGLVDDGATCGAGYACRNGVCVYDFCDGIEVGCAEGYQCTTLPDGFKHCVVASCGTVGICPTGSTCTNGACVSPNDGLQCAAPSTPAGGFCAGGGCYEAGCGAGQLCRGGACVADPCGGIICPGGTFCRQGDCVQACAFVPCGAGQRCDVDGFCVADPCAGKSCSPTQLCVGGACVADPCDGLRCPHDQVCAGGACVDDPCVGITCPVGQCQSGQCFATGSSAGVAAKAAASGCGCASGGPGTPLALLALLALAPLARHRRRRRLALRGAPLLGLLLLLGAATGCTKAATFDPASCTAPGVGLIACEGENRCVDLVLDPSHCGACGRACEAGQTCVDRGCFPAGSVAPYLGGLAPVTLPRGGFSPVRLDFTGLRFAAGATVRATHLGGTTTYAANVLDAGHLSALIDLKTAPAETWQFRVVNPDRVISNSRGVPVVVPTPVITDYNPKAHAIGAVVTVLLTGTGFMSDSACMIGGGSVIDQVVATTLTAAGLECTLDLSTFGAVTFQLWVANPQGSGSPLLSLKKDFSATGNSAPTLTQLAPASDQVNTVTQVRAYGSGFDATSRVVLIYRNPATSVSAEQVQATTLISPVELYVPSLDLLHCPPLPPATAATACPLSSATASYFMKVVNGGTVSTVELPYAVVSNAPSINPAPSPATAFQGDLAPVTVSGLNLPVGSVLQYQPPGGSFIDSLSPPSTSTTTVTAVLDLIGSPAGSRPAGLYALRLKYPSGALSPTLAFTVLSNVAVVQSVTPSGGVQRLAPLPVTLAVSNLRPLPTDVRVVFSAQPNVLLVPTSVTATAVNLSLAMDNRDAGLFTLQVKNPNGAQLSAPANFTITPGLPTVTGVACTAIPLQCPTASSAPQQPNRVPITITGTNFAKPDAYGFNGSTVHIFANCTPTLTANQVTGCTCTPGLTPCVPDQVLNPIYNQVTVRSPTQIDVLLDTTTAFVPNGASASYSLWVWNPGGTPAPQRSGQQLDAFTITSAP